ncbi:MAG: hypothetical protein ACTSPJ_08360 [Candidatus Heimdallarchaeaceae archaeon]
MLIALFKLEDIGPALTQMVTSEETQFEEEIIDKFEFSGAMTYSLVFQGVVDIDEISSELYGPFPFAFSEGFVQYAFSFLVDDPTMQDKRMKKKTIGLLLCLVPEIVSKIDDFREEFAKLLIYKFHNIKSIDQVDEKLLTSIVNEYERIVRELLSVSQANLLTQELKELISKGLFKTKVKKIALLYSKKEVEKIKNSFASFLLTLPFTFVKFEDEVGIIKTKTFQFSIIPLEEIDSNIANEQEVLLLMLDIMKEKYLSLKDSLLKKKNLKKIGVLIRYNVDIEKLSEEYGAFFNNLQDILNNVTFFSSSYSTTKEFKTKLLEAFFWGLIP